MPRPDDIVMVPIDAEQIRAYLLGKVHAYREQGFDPKEMMGDEFVHGMACGIHCTMIMLLGGYPSMEHMTAIQDEITALIEVLTHE